MKNIRDGWHKVYGYDVYVLEGKVIRGTKRAGTLPAYPYRHINGGKAWISDREMSLAAFAAGVKRGTVRLF